MRQSVGDERKETMVHELETIKTTHSPLSELQTALKADEDYAWTWQCNLACIGLDCGGSHETSNRYAAQFMRNAFGVDVTTQENWKKFETIWKEGQSHDQGS